MTYYREEVEPDQLDRFKLENYKEMTDDRLRCQHCQGFYWRLWFDQAQCLACQNYTVVEVKPVKEIKIGLGVFTNFSNLLQVDWIREQLNGGPKDSIEDHNTAFMHRRVKDPLSDRTEFIIFKDKLRCRVTGTETAISPEISGYWILGKVPKVEGKSLTEEEALEIVRRNADKESDGSRNS